MLYVLILVRDAPFAADKLQTFANSETTNIGCVRITPELISRFSQVVHVISLASAIIWAN